MTSTGLPSTVPIHTHTNNSATSEVSQIPRIIRIMNGDKITVQSQLEVGNSKSCSHDKDAKAGVVEHKPVPALGRMSKRSSSTSNDLIYERDRFRARLQTFNRPEYEESSVDPERDSDSCIEKDDACEVCDGIIGSKTTKLNVMLDRQFEREDVIEEDISPLESHSRFFQEDLRRIKLFPDMKNTTCIKSLTFPQLQSVFNWYFNKPLPPTKDMFPWLHGLHADNFAQRQYFISQLGQFALENTTHSKPESARFLMCVNSSSKSLLDQPLLKNTVRLHEILQPIDISKSEVAILVKDIVNKIFEDEEQSTIDELTKLFFDDSIAMNHLPVFLNLDPDSGVSLRNFHIQVAKLALCSDFIVYCFHKNHSTSSCDCGAMARIIWLAQEYGAYNDSLQKSRYNVFIPDDAVCLEELLLKGTECSGFNELFTFKPNNSVLASSLESNKKTQINFNLDAFKSNTLSIWDNDYQIKEKIETTRMSAATKIHKNVWVGNIWDHQIMITQLHKNPEDMDFRGSKKLKDLYCDPGNSIITKDTSNSNDIFNYLPHPKANWRLFIHCHNDASFPDLPTLSSLLFKYTISSHHSIDQEFHTLEFPPSGSIGLGDCRKETLMAIVNTCKLLYLYSSSTSNDLDVLSSLIYCSDGYTELSLLVLCYLMYSQNIELGQAILELHLDYGRPFYIFNSDVTILKKLEVILNKFSPLTMGTSINWRELETITSKELNELFLPQRTSSIPNQPIAKNLKLGYIVNDSDTESSSDSDDEDFECTDGSSTPADWVKDVEGSLPSRVLPYLYLGSLKHANSLPLLSKLGIKKIISVGEPLFWLHGARFQKNFNISIDELDHGNIEMYNIVPSNPKASSCSVETVMKVNNLQDDGIDELSSSLPSILKYIDNEYRMSNGETKILVHCRVGVSRSATVVIAEVMKRLNISLPKAYLYVRVRRLNIIVQPNLRFMYELFKWEEEEKKKLLMNGSSDTNDNKDSLREIDWFVMCREIMNLNLPYLMK